MIWKIENFSFLLDCYENFGWKLDERSSERKVNKDIQIHLRRERKIINKAELTRLQRNFEGCMKEIKELERAKTGGATMVALIVGIFGTAFMAGAVFSITWPTPHIILSIMLSIPAFIGWLIPYYLYRNIVMKKTKELMHMIDEKKEEI